MSITDPALSETAPHANPIGVGIVGLGFMGQTHLTAYQAAIAGGAAAQVLAVADADPERRAGIPSIAGNLLETGTSPEPLFHPSGVTGYEHARDLFADPRIDLVSVCTPTDTHVSLALEAFRHAKHVLLEKPVALDAGHVETLAAAAREAGVVCIPAMCMRLWPAWAWAKQAIDSHRFGRVLAARFERCGSAPTWGQSFYNDPARSGGALFDFHVHDADFVVHCFGPPDAVDASGTRSHVSTTYRYDSGPALVQAECGWLSSPHFPFRMRYTVEFEHAVADFDFARDPQLLVYTAERTEEPELSTLTGYDAEIRLAIEAATTGTQPSPTLNDAAVVTRVLQAEAESLDTGEPVRLQ